jgi:hypothetical protein
MKIGPDKVIACPSCKGLAKYPTLMSWNGCDVRVWTDGRQQRRMVPFPPAVMKCRHCASVRWLSEGRKVGEVERWRQKAQKTRPSWRSAECVQEPEEFDYYQAIRGGLGRTREEELDLRILAWQRSNDAYRELGVSAATTPQPSSPERDDNLRALALLADEANEQHLMMKAEVHRELRMWPEAEGILGRVRAPELSRLVGQIRGWCESQNAIVQEFESCRSQEHIEPKAIPSELNDPLECPHCGNRSIRYRQVSSGRLVCLACSRSMPRPEYL